MASIFVDRPGRGNTKSLELGKKKDREITSPLWLGESTSDQVVYFLASGLNRTVHGLGRTEQTEILSLETPQPDFGRLSPLVGLPFEIPDPGSMASYLRQHPGRECSQAYIPRFDRA